MLLEKNELQKEEKLPKSFRLAYRKLFAVLS